MSFLSTTQLKGGGGFSGVNLRYLRESLSLTLTKGLPTVWVRPPGENPFRGRATTHCLFPRPNHGSQQVHFRVPTGPMLGSCREPELEAELEPSRREK